MNFKTASYNDRNFKRFFKISGKLLRIRNRIAKIAETIYMVLALCFIMTGSLVSSDFVWELTDMFNNLMVIPNAIALFALTKTVVKIAGEK